MKIRPQQIREGEDDEKVYNLSSVLGVVEWVPAADDFGSGRRAVIEWEASGPAGVAVPGELTDLPYGIRILSLEASASSRIRFYATRAQRDRDKARPLDTRAEGNHGVLAEFVFSDAGRYLVASPAIDMANMEIPAIKEFAYNVTRYSTEQAPVRFRMTYHETETKYAL